MTFTVFVEDDMDEFNLGGIYYHLCDWEGNTEGTMCVDFSHVEHDVAIGDPEIFKTVPIY